jgi:hypothetical protein
LHELWASAQGLLQLTNDLPLAIVVIGTGPALRIIETIKGVKSKIAPELMPTGPIELLYGLTREIIESTLKALDLNNGHANRAGMR